MSHEVRIVRNGYGQIGTEDAVVLHDHNYRIDDVGLLPNPIVVAIDVDAEKSDLTGEPGFAQQIVDIVAINKSAIRGEGVTPINFIFPDEADKILAAVHDQAPPVIVQQQKARVRLPIIPDAELDKRIRQRRQAMNEILNDPIVTELGKSLELGIA